jgi:glutathione peroxidase
VAQPRIKNLLKKLQFLAISLLLCNVVAPSISAAEDIYSFKFPNSAGGEINMADYKGKTILLFASSTDCGYKDQYADFQKIYEEYKDFVVIGVSSDDLNLAETRSGAAISKFCEGRFGTTYPISDVVKISTWSKKVHPFFVWAKENGLRFEKNFEKVLIDKNGVIVKKFKRDHKPTSGYVRKQIEKVL